MNLWDKLFSKTPTAEDFLVQLKEVEREQRIKRREMEVKQQNKSNLVKKAVQAEKNGQTELVREVYRDLRQLDIDAGHLNKELEVLSLSRTALKEFSRKLEVLEKRKDPRSIRSIIDRFQKSGIQAKINAAEVSEDILEDELSRILTDVETQVSTPHSREDAGFDEFRKTIATIAQSDEGGPEAEDIAKYNRDIDRIIKGSAERLPND